MTSYEILKALSLACLVILIAFTCWMVINHANGQNTTPPKPVTSPPNPTPTTPTPNFQYLPQKAYVLPYAPENGIPITPPLNSPLPPTPLQVQPVPQQNNSTGMPTDILGVLAMVGAAGAYIKGHLAKNKVDRVQEVTRENSVQIAKGTDVDKSLADRIYRNMSDGGESIKDQPEIKLENLSKNKQEATQTASKA